MHRAGGARLWVFDRQAGHYGVKVGFEICSTCPYRGDASSVPIGVSGAGSTYIGPALRLPPDYLTSVLPDEAAMAEKQKLTTTVSTKGQVIWPKVIRDQRHWAAGTELVVEDTPDGVLLKAKRPPLRPPGRKTYSAPYPMRGRQSRSRI